MNGTEPIELVSFATVRTEGVLQTSPFLLKGDVTCLHVNGIDMVFATGNGQAALLRLRIDKIALPWVTDGETSLCVHNLHLADILQELRGER